ncbi:MAG: hypothetical protein ACP5JP_01460 [bacterium]
MKGIAKRSLYVVYIIALLVYPDQAKGKPIVLDRIVASIEGVGVITNVQLIQYAAVNAVLKSGYSQSIEQLNNYDFMRTSLDRLIDRTLILRDAQLLSLSKPDQQEIDNLVGEFKKKFNSQIELEKFMHQYAITDKYLEKFMSDRMLVEHYLKYEVGMFIRVSDKDIEQYYNHNKVQFKNISWEEAKKTIKNFLEKQEYEKQLKAWIKTLTLNRQIIIMY